MYLFKTCMLSCMLMCYNLPRGDRMASQAKLDANKRYLEKQDSFLLRFPKGRKEEVQTFAKNVKGKSLNSYIIGLIEEDMQNEEQ